MEQITWTNPLQNRVLHVYTMDTRYIIWCKNKTI